MFLRYSIGDIVLLPYYIIYGYSKVHARVIGCTLPRNRVVHYTRARFQLRVIAGNIWRPCTLLRIISQNFSVFVASLVIAMFSNSALTSSSSSFHSPPSLRRGSASTPGADISSSSESSFILSKERGYGTVRTTEESVSDSGQSRRKQIWEKLRRALVVCLLVLLIVFAACAYSMVGPFLPIEVYTYSLMVFKSTCSCYS